MSKFPSKIFLDGGVPAETAEAKKLLGFLDGQTTNPTLIAKNLIASYKVRPSKRDERSESYSRSAFLTERQGRTFQSLTSDLALAEYKRIVREMSKIIPRGSVSIQVFANAETKAEEMIKQARLRHRWIPNSSIKLPCIKEGLKAAEVVCREFPINITLVFSQSQAAAVYEATKSAKYPVFLSPFVGRLDDRGEEGMDVISNIMKMYQTGDHHVEVLTASVRHLGHLFRAFELKSDIVTIPLKVFKQWADLGFPESPKNTSDGGKLRRSRSYDSSEVKRSGKTDLLSIPYDPNIKLGKPWSSYDLHHPLTERGVNLFWNDWMGLF